MAKLPTIDRFRISCEVEVSDLGPIIAQLTKMGLTNVNFELMTEIPAFAQKAHHAVKAEDFLREWIGEHPTFSAKEAVAHFRQSGRTDGACYSALPKLVADKTLKKVGPGNYARSDVKAIAAPKKEKKAAKAIANAQKYPVSHAAFIERIAKRKHGHFTTADIKTAFEKQGRPASSASPSINELLTKQVIRRVGGGEYELTAAPAKTNGAALTPVEGVAHG
jgi:hypothetical protein